MSPRLRPSCLLFLCLLAAATGWGAPEDWVVDLRVATAASSPYLTLSWTQRQQSAITSQAIHRRLKSETVWVRQADLTTTQTSWPDPTALPGVEYEYWMERRINVFPSVARGHISAGTEVPAIEQRGTLLLVIDDSMVSPLAPEIAQLVEDLTGDGWLVQTIVAPRTVAPSVIRTLIRNAYIASPATVKSVYLLGHVPVPYSGLIAPDGHPDHYGAWPADGYYGDMDAYTPTTGWTDTTANSSTNAARIQNVPGDGKFDPSTLPSPLELQVGRVDMSNMSKAPAPAITETQITRRYLRKAHDFRHRQGAYANIPRVSMIRDGFGTFSGENFASNGWAAAYSCVGLTVTQAPSNGWYTTATNNSFLFAHGDGGGSYESAGTVGTSTEFGRKPSRAVFTQLFGSYHGDFDANNNFMRAALAGNASGDSLGLACMWAGRPHWFLHPCGMGETLGYSAKLSQTNTGSDYQFSNGSGRAIQLALMGDPTLRFHMVIPPRGLSGSSANGQVTLSWAASAEAGLIGYHVYRASVAAGPYTRLTSSPLSSPSFTDATAAVGQTYTYMVRTLKLESVPGGSYRNLSQGVFVTLAATAAVTGAPPGPSGLTAQANSSAQTLLIWTDHASDETAYRVERRTGPTAAFTTLATLPANTTSHTDPGPLAGPNVYYYRVVATGPGGDSPPSGLAFAEAHAGLFETGAAYQHADRATGTAGVPIVRFVGGTGALNIGAATGDFTAVAGTHYTAVNASIPYADGEQGTKNVPVTLLTPSQPQLPRQFRLTVFNPTGGAALGTTTFTRVTVQDSRATLSAPWQQIELGTVTDSVPAVSAEGAIGDAIAGGSLGTADNGRFIYQNFSGNAVITAFVEAPLPVQAGARMGVMARGGMADGSLMAGALIAGNATGTNHYSRAVIDIAPTLTPNDSNALLAPRWVRLTRNGNTFTSETSQDGATFTTLGSTVLPIAASAQWGLFHSGDTSGDLQTARFKYVAITPLGVLSTPTSPSASALSGAGGVRNQISWDPVGGATGYRVEFRPLHGTFTQLGIVPAGTTTLTHSGPAAGIVYEYRVQAYSETLTSAFTSPLTVTTVGTPTNYQLWLQENTLPMDASGEGGLDAAPASDGIPNTLKYALGLNPHAAGYQGRLSYGTTSDGTNTFMTLAVVYPTSRSAAFVFKLFASINYTTAFPATWSQTGVPGVVQTGVPTPGLRTRTFTDTVPMGPATPRRFLRLQVMVPTS